MKLKVSFCNKTVLRTDITRYAPLWGGYSLMLAVLVLMFLGVGGEDKDRVYTSLVVMFSKRAGQMALINGFYALFVAQALWEDLLAPRMCNSLHAMPVTRDGYFGAHLVAALLFALIPNVLVYGIAALLVPSVVAQAALLTLGAACLQYIFYLGAALVSVQLAGNRVGMGAGLWPGEFPGHPAVLVLQRGFCAADLWPEAGCDLDHPHLSYGGYVPGQLL